MVEKGDLHQELGQSTSLNIVIVGFRNSSNPRVGRAVRGNVEFERLFHKVVLHQQAEQGEKEPRERKLT